MTDYIDRQAAIDAICKHGTELERRGITVLAVVNHKQVTVDLLENLPSAEVEPVKHGRWELHEDDSWSGGGFTKCSACGYGFAWGAFFEVEEWEFCPHCGANMYELEEL